MNDDEDELPTCPDDEGWYLCCQGFIYGPCEDERCGGVCEYKHECECQGCDHKNCCKKATAR